MGQPENRHVICYDIPDDRRRARIAKLLDSHGDRVQFSVYEAVLDRELSDKLIGQLRALLAPGEDLVTIYRLCAACAERVTRLGLAGRQPAPGEEEVFIV